MRRLSVVFFGSLVAFATPMQSLAEDKWSKVEKDEDSDEETEEEDKEKQEENDGDWVKIEEPEVQELPPVDVPEISRDKTIFIGGLVISAGMLTSGTVLLAKGMQNRQLLKEEVQQSGNYNGESVLSQQATINRQLVFGYTSLFIGVGCGGGVVFSIPQPDTSAGIGLSWSGTW